MTWQQIFLAEGQLRPIWRFFLSAGLVVITYVTVGIGVSLAFGFLGVRPSQFGVLFWANLAILPVLLCLYWILSGRLDRKPLASVGLAFRGRWRTELAIGLGVGTAMILLVAALELALGLVEFRPSLVAVGALVTSGGFCFLVMLVAATNEEVVFRGYPFQRLVESVGAVGAVLIFAALFGVVHLGNPHRSLFSTLNTILVGVPLAVAYLRTRALWLPIGIHFAWNFMQGFGLGLPVSGIAVPETILTARVTGHAWLTGGNYGPEGGLLTLLVILAATAYLLRAKSIYVSKEMKELLLGPHSLPTLHQEVSAAPLALSDQTDRGEAGRV